LTNPLIYYKFKPNILIFNIFSLNMSKNFILKLYQQPQTVFSFTDLTLLFPQKSPKSLQNKIHYATKTNKLQNLRRGIYAKPNFQLFELANKIYTPSYISFETVLLKEDIVFQTYQTIFLASYLTRTVSVDQQSFSFKKLKSSLLSNPQGLTLMPGYTIATKERAFLDAVYLYGDYHFDNLRPLDWNLINQLTPIYQNKAFNKRVKKYYTQSR